jgi:hypothetical protein
MTKRYLVASLYAVALPAISSASIVTTQVSTNNGTDNLPNPYTASSTDLLNGLTPISTGNFNQEGTGGVPVLTDGQVPATVSRVQPNPTGFQYGSFATGGNTGGTQLIYTLTGAQDIGSITVLGGWQDGGRDEQSFSILYALASSPLVFIPLVTVDYNPTDSTPVATPPTGNTHPTLTKITFTDTTGVLASNVSKIRFDFNATENGYSGYSEIDVVRAVPEPSAVALLSFAVVGLAARRRRN